MAYPGDATLRLDVKQNSGVIAHWKSQPLYMPFTAAALGVAGNYIDVTDVVIDNQLSGNRVAADLRDRDDAAGSEAGRAALAGHRNVCIEGRAQLACQLRLEELVHQEPGQNGPRLEHGKRVRADGDRQQQHRSGEQQEQSRDEASGAAQRGGRAAARPGGNVAR